MSSVGFVGCVLGVLTMQDNERVAIAKSGPKQDGTIYDGDGLANSLSPGLFQISVASLIP